MNTRQNFNIFTNNLQGKVAAATQWATRTIPAESEIADRKNAIDGNGEVKSAVPTPLNARFIGYLPLGNVTDQRPPVDEVLHLNASQGQEPANGRDDAVSKTASDEAVVSATGDTTPTQETANVRDGASAAGDTTPTQETANVRDGASAAGVTGSGQEQPESAKLLLPSISPRSHASATPESYIQQPGQGDNGNGASATVYSGWWNSIPSLSSPFSCCGQAIVKEDELTVDDDKSSSKAKSAAAKNALEASKAGLPSSKPESAGAENAFVDSSINNGAYYG